MAVVLRLDAADAQVVCSGLKSVEVEYGLLAHRRHVAHRVVAAVGYQSGLATVGLPYVVLDALVVRHDAVGPAHTDVERELEEALGHGVPLVAPVLEAVDVDHDSRARQHLEHRQEHASRHAQHENRVITPQGLKHRQNVVRHAHKPVGVQRQVA
jgi:hypothetical protein